MLRQLSIKNFAIVDLVTMEFGPGFNVLTGETGAGKSMIVDALYFLLGDRITAVKKLAEWGISVSNDEILIKREFTRSAGKTRSFVNGEMATASMIAELGDWLVDIHGQHEHQAIFNVGRHRQLIDAFGHHEKLLAKTAEAYERLSELLIEQTR